MLQFVKGTADAVVAPVPAANGGGPCDADLRLIAREPRLPGLATLLDREALAAYLATHVAPSGSSVVARTTYLRYKPGASCLAAFEATIDGRPLRGYALAYPHDAAKLRKLASNGTATIDHRQSIAVVLSPQDLVLQRIRTWLEAPHHAFASWSATHPLESQLQCNVVRYKPERRLVARLSCDGAPWAALRLYAPRDYLRARQNAKVLAGLSELKTPRRIGHSHRDRGLLLEWLPGRRLSDALAANDATTDDLHATGLALARLHEQRHVKLQFAGHQDDCDQVMIAANAIAAVAPELTPRTTRLAGRIVESLAACPERITVRHGDFYGDQVLLDREAALLDLDQAGQGDPALDIGNFVAHLIRHNVSGTLSRDNVDRAIAMLLAGYSDVREAPAPEHVSAYTAASLLRLAVEPFRHRDPDWLTTTESLLSRIDELLVERTSPGSRGVAPATAASVTVESPLLPPRHRQIAACDDPALPQMRLALDRAEAERQLSHLLATRSGSDGDLRLDFMEIVRHKPGRRCLVEYQVRAGQRQGEASDVTTLLGKTMRRPHAARDFQLHHAVFTSAFGDGAADGVSIPEPLGVVPAWNMWFQRKVAGVSAEVVLAGADGPSTAKHVAQAIYKLHQHGPPPPRTHSLLDELTILEARLIEAAHQRPDLAVRIADVASRCRALAETLAPAEIRPCHRDFYPNQVLVDGPRLWLCDFDLYSSADPALDVGNFAAHLIEQGIRCPALAPALEASRAAFLHSYCEIAPDVSRASLAVYETLALARHIGLSLSIEGRSASADAILQRCEQRLSQVAAPRPPL